MLSLGTLRHNNNRFFFGKLKLSPTTRPHHCTVACLPVGFPQKNTHPPATGHTFAFCLTRRYPNIHLFQKCYRMAITTTHNHTVRPRVRWSFLLIWPDHQPCIDGRIKSSSSVAMHRYMYISKWAGISTRQTMGLHH